VVDEQALAAGLRSGHIGAIGFDVFEEEPPPDNSPLLAFDQAILSPHIAGLTLECAERMAVMSVQNVIDYFAGTLSEDLVVNKAAIDA
jgi:D-3-phosphoglycerate dehydrogenase